MLQTCPCPQRILLACQQKIPFSHWWATYRRLHNRQAYCRNSQRSCSRTPHLQFAEWSLYEKTGWKLEGIPIQYWISKKTKGKSQNSQKTSYETGEDKLTLTSFFCWSLAFYGAIWGEKKGKAQNSPMARGYSSSAHKTPTLVLWKRSPAHLKIWAEPIHS